MRIRVQALTPLLSDARQARPYALTSGAPSVEADSIEVVPPDARDVEAFIGKLYLSGFLYEGK